MLETHNMQPAIFYFAAAAHGSDAGDRRGKKPVQKAGSTVHRITLPALALPFFSFF
jgi:hypothetical protein